MTVELLRAIGYLTGQVVAMLSAIALGVGISVRAWRSDARRSRWSKHGLSATDLAYLHPLAFLAVVAASNRTDAARLAEGLGHGWPRAQRTRTVLPWTVTAFITGLATMYACRHLPATGLPFVWATTMITFGAFAGGLWVGIGCVILYDYLVVRVSPLRGAGIAVGIALELRTVPDDGSRYLRRSSRARASKRVVDAFDRLRMPMTEVRERQQHALEDAGWADFQQMAARLIARAYEGEFVGTHAPDALRRKQRQGLRALWTAGLAFGAVPVVIGQLHEIVTAIADIGSLLPW